MSVTPISCREFKTPESAPTNNVTKFDDKFPDPDEFRRPTRNTFVHLDAIAEADTTLEEETEPTVSSNAQPNPKRGLALRKLEDLKSQEAAARALLRKK